MSVTTNSKPALRRASATAGPERSDRSPRADESLTVSTAAVRLSAVEEDIFFFPRSPAALAFGFVEHAEPLHQQALGVERSGLLRSLSFKVDLKIPASPAQNFKNSGVAGQGSIRRMGYLTFAEVHFAFLIIIGQRQRSALAAHFEGLHQVNHIHLREAAAQNAIRGHGFCHLLQCNLIDDALDAIGGFLQKERLLDEVVHRILER